MNKTFVVDYNAATDSVVVSKFTDQNEAQKAFLALDPKNPFRYKIGSLTELSAAKVPFKILYGITAALGKPITKFKTREIAEKEIFTMLNANETPVETPATVPATAAPVDEAAVASVKAEAEKKAAEAKAAAEVKAQEKAAKAAANKLAQEAKKTERAKAREDAKAAKVAAKEARKTERAAKKLEKANKPSGEQVRGRNGSDVISVLGTLPKFGASRAKRLGELTPGMTLSQYCALSSKGERQNDLQVALWHGCIAIAAPVTEAVPVTEPTTV